MPIRHARKTQYSPVDWLVLNFEKKGSLIGNWRAALTEPLRLSGEKVKLGRKSSVGWFQLKLEMMYTMLNKSNG